MLGVLSPQVLLPEEHRVGAGGSFTRTPWGRSLGLAVLRIVRDLASLRN